MSPLTITPGKPFGAVIEPAADGSHLPALWAQVQGFEAGSTFRGGTRIETSSGVVHSIAPCSWWGGPAEAADLEALRREAHART